jgi:hypothetical protein
VYYNVFNVSPVYHLLDDYVPRGNKILFELQVSAVDDEAVNKIQEYKLYFLIKAM